MDNFGAYAISPWREKLRGQIPYYLKKNRTFASILRHISLFGAGHSVDVETDLHGKVRLQVKNNITDKHVYRGQHVMGASDREIFSKVCSQKAAVGESIHFVDVGTNSGLFSLEALMLAREVGAKYKFICIEPNPEMVSRLTKNFSFNEAENISIKACAVSDSDGELFLDISNKNLGEANIIAEPSANSVKVPVRKLIDILEEENFPRPDILKIDVEGHEVPALSSLLTVPHMRPNYIFVEIAHDKHALLPKLFSENDYTEINRSGINAVFVLKSKVETYGKS
ncbi:FkbM family methyltransferase [Ahrensia kielensis]|uniref:FkbM family methyltransferase n=1 Tax=Ahrensia kielensis TaxID=76980 RepID=A0ABU9T9Q2_9HYPH